jgi:hypothetical protein
VADLEHDWRKDRSEEDECHVYRCRRCGLVTDEVLPGVPNVSGARYVEKCDVATARSVMES